MTFETLLIETKGPIGYLTLNMPKRMPRFCHSETKVLNCQMSVFHQLHRHYGGNMPAITQNKMVSASVPSHIYNQLTEAASLIGATINQFLVQSAIEKAEAILERERVIKMTKQDAEVFFDAIENPPSINHKLLMAMQAYQETFPNAENRGTQPQAYP